MTETRFIQIARWIAIAAGPKRSMPVILAVSTAVVGCAARARTLFWLPGAIALMELVAAAAWIGTKRFRAVILNAILVGAVLVALEGYLLWCGVPHDAGVEPPLRTWFRLREGGGSEVYYYPTLLWHPDDILGWSEKPNANIRERRYSVGQLISAVTYATDDQGFRRVPIAAAPSADVLLFGCSMTWGSNINDQESYPWQLGELLGPKVQVHNYGLPGTGPNTMLAMLQAGYVDKSLSSRRVVGAYYVAWLNRSVGHLARVLGRVPWSADSPRYRLSEGASPFVVADGRHPVTFDQYLLRHSMLTAQIGRGLARLRTKTTYTDSDLSLMAGIVAESDRVLRERMNVPLAVIILRDRSSPDLERSFEERLKLKGIRVISLSLARSDYIPRDVHPNARGARRLAELVHNDLQEPQPTSGGG